MKSHISATIDQDLLKDVDRVGREERRSRSQIIELALELLLRDRGATGDEVVTSRGRFEGKFTRADTYAR
jgi:metal-responsive CopG/Arc/MetJ family transcriptional regulator